MDKKKDKQEPEYLYKGKPVQNDAKLIKRLVADGRLEVRKNITIYELHEGVDEAMDCGFCFDLTAVIDAIECLVNDLKDLGEDLCGIKEFDYKEDGSVTINGRKYAWSGAAKRLEKLGLIKIKTHQTIYHASEDEYWYQSVNEPLEFLYERSAYSLYEYISEKEGMI